ncbi:MAG: DinB family protein [Bacteroidota bacterium]
MENLFDYTREQYEHVCQSREVLFNYCRMIDAAHMILENSSFGRGGSIRNLLVHVANTYEYWIGECALHRSISFTPYSSIKSMDEIDCLFIVIDKMMYAFIETFKDPQVSQVSYNLNGLEESAGAFKLFTHVITHEFHHKGQILSISRHLGYTPVDTDIMRY